MNRQMKMTLLTGILVVLCLLNAGTLCGQTPAPAAPAKPDCFAVRINLHATDGIQRRQTHSFMLGSFVVDTSAETVFTLHHH